MLDIESTEEGKRLVEARLGNAAWRLWGPYLSERQWGTVREDYSPYGTAWEYFPHDHARSPRLSDGEKMAWRVFRMRSNDFALLWHYGMEKIPSLRNAFSALQDMKAIMAKMSKNIISMLIMFLHMLT